MRPDKPKVPAGRTPKPPPLTHANLTLSFQYYDEAGPFGPAAGSGYVGALLGRLRDVCRMTALRSGPGRGLRYHPIDWAETTRPDGFTHLNATLRSQIVPHQFSVSSNEHGRVHGFWIDDTFFVVWLDPGHELYAAK